MAPNILSDLAGKVAIVTGSSSGIGLSVAELFASQGCSVVITGRNPEGLQKAKEACVKAGLDEGKILIAPGDLTDEKYLEDLISQTIAKFGKLNILVNNAGGMVDMGTISDTPMVIFDKMMNINLRSPIALAKLCIPELLKTKGSIVNVSTAGALRAARMFAYYAIVKAGLDHFTRCLAVELAPKGVRVNGVNPGFVHTNLLRDSPEFLQNLPKLEAMHPIGRGAQPVEIANAIVFLASDASSFTTGQSLPLDGGVTVGFPM